MDLERLADPFPPEDVEWRVQSSGMSNNGKPWARVLAYVTARAIMDRLDAALGPQNWQVVYNHVERGVMCRISVRCHDDDGSIQWVGKEDGAEPTQVEAFKGGISSALKRAGAAWGIGRYLYKLDAGFAECSKDTKAFPHYGKTKDGTAFSWGAPKLPAWALPGSQRAPAAPQPSIPDESDHAIASLEPPAKGGDEERRELTEAERSTNAQKTKIALLRSEGGVPEEQYREYLRTKYRTDTATTLTVAEASELIENLIKRNEREKGAVAPDRVRQLREQLVGLCVKLKNMTVPDGALRGAGLGVDSPDELVDLTPSMEDERELESVITKLDKVFEDSLPF